MTQTKIAFPGGEILVRRTPWDERVLAVPTAEITRFGVSDPAVLDSGFDALEDWCGTHHVGYVNGRFPPDRALRAALERNGFAHVETTLVLSGRPVMDLPRIPAGGRVTLRALTARDLPAVQEIAYRNFHHGRLLEDPAVPEDAARTRTANWVADLHRRGIAFAAWSGGELIGFHSEVIGEGRCAELILSGVSGRHSPMALSLWVAVMARLRSRGVHHVSAPVSAANTGVINVFAALGFRVDRTWFGYRRFRP